MTLEELKNARQFVVGTRQTKRVVEDNSARVVYIASDAEERITLPVVQACRQKGIEVRYVDSMALLGKACNIKVGAAMAAVIEK